METDLSEDEQMSILMWLDQIPLSRPKKDVETDFRDGVMVAEIVKFHFPSMVELHNYTPCHNTSNMEINWHLMNRKVFRKLGMEVAKDTISAIVNRQKGIILKFLIQLRIYIERKASEKKAKSVKSESDGRFENEKPEVDQMGGVSQKGTKFKSKKNAQLGSRTSGARVVQRYRRTEPDPATELNMLYEEKVQECLCRDETISILLGKIKQLENTVNLKDRTIDDLQQAVEAMRPTGKRF